MGNGIVHKLYVFIFVFHLMCQTAGTSKGITSSTHQVVFLPSLKTQERYITNAKVFAVNKSIVLVAPTCM